MFLVFADFGSFVKFSKPFKMSATEDSATEDLSKIKGKPVDAIGHMLFHIDFEKFKSPFCVEKIFGLVDVKTNAVLKFKIVVSEDGPTKIKFKLTYVSEEPIDCKIKIGKCPSKILEHLTISDKVDTFHCNKENLATVARIISISVLVITRSTTSTNFARMFNNQSTSDFIVKCQYKNFYVHQSILRERNDYFEAILHNDCIEKRDKMLKIDDFTPKVVEIFLRCLYNGALPISDSLSWHDMAQVIKIADKYNANEMLDAMDSYTSQRLLINLNLLDDIKIRHYLKEFEEVQAPKVTTMFFKWRSTEKGRNSLDDNQWSSLIRKIPNFAILGGITGGRNDYQSWVRQHISWCLSYDKTIKGRNDFSVLVGPIGEMKGAVKCSPI